MHVKRAGAAMRMRQVVFNVLLFALLVACAGPAPPSTPQQPPAPKPEIHILDPRDYPDTSPRSAPTPKTGAKPMTQREPIPLQTQQVDYDSKELRRRLLRLIDSLQSREAVSVANVERIMGIKLPPDPNYSKGHAGVAHLNENREKSWGFSAVVEWIYGYDSPPRIEIALFPDGPKNPKLARSQVCSFETASLAKEIVALGYDQGRLPRRPGIRGLAFNKEFREQGIWVSAGMYSYVVGDEDDSSTWVECVESIDISWSNAS